MIILPGQPEPRPTPSWEFSPKARKALVGALLTGRKSPLIKRTIDGPKVRFDAFAVDGRRRRIELLFEGRLMASTALPDALRLDDRLDVSLGEGTSGTIGVRVIGP